MKKSSNRGSVIFLSIIAFAGLGLSGYMFTMDLISEEPNFGNLKLVGLWDSLGKNVENNPLHSAINDFLIEYEDDLVIDSEYVEIINNTRFFLSIPGI